MNVRWIDTSLQGASEPGCNTAKGKGANAAIGACTGLVSRSERQVILERLYERCDIRRQIGTRHIKITEVYRMQVKRRAITTYEAMLEPYLQDLFAAADWPLCLEARLRLATKLHRRAADRLFLDRRINDPRRGMPDVLAVMKRLGPANSTCDI